jgi:predicted TIM-barrel fold metal-dependent hydrolase
MQTPWGEIPVSDAHVHFFGYRFLESLGRLCGKSAEEAAAAAGWDPPAIDPAETARAWAAELDCHGVARSALIGSFPGDEESIAAALAAVPGRFHGYFMLDACEPDAAARARRAFAAGLKTVCLFPAMHRYSVLDARLEPVFETAANAGRAVFVHCGVLTVGVRRKLGLPSPFDMSRSNPIDLHAVAMRFPTLPFIVPHFGAGYFREALMLADLCHNVYFDTSSSNSWMRYEQLDLATVFRRALDIAGPGRLLFGTDSSFFPRGWNREVFDRQVAALRKVGIGCADARRILGENLEKILGDEHRR